VFDRQILNRKRRLMGGFSLIELLIVIAIILIILAMALPKLNKARMQAMETGAIKAVTTIHTAQAQYYSQFGKYADSLTALGPPTSGNPSASAADLISGDLASGEKGGFKYTLQITPQGYTVNANPIAFNNTGGRTFYSDQSLVIRQNMGVEPATAASPEIK
jgi:type IV pilus assembly protein PilA